MRRDSLDADVATVGYGTVGQTLTALLTALGHSVAVYVRYPSLDDLSALVDDLRSALSITESRITAHVR